MITTVTTTTVTTVTTITAMGLTAGMGIVAVVGLILLLTTKELVASSGSGTFLRISRFVNVGILPLVLAFTVIVAVKIAEVLT